MTLVDSYGIAVVRTALIGYIRVVGTPVTVRQTADAVLRDDVFLRLAVLRADEHQLRRTVPHSTAEGLAAQHILHDRADTVTQMALDTEEVRVLERIRIVHMAHHQFALLAGFLEHEVRDETLEPLYLVIQRVRSRLGDGYGRAVVETLRVIVRIGLLSEQTHLCSVRNRQLERLEARFPLKQDIIFLIDEAHQHRVRILTRHDDGDGHFILQPSLLGQDTSI